MVLFQFIVSDNGTVCSMWMNFTPTSMLRYVYYIWRTVCTSVSVQAIDLIRVYCIRCWIQYAGPIIHMFHIWHSSSQFHVVNSSALPAREDSFAAKSATRRATRMNINTNTSEQFSSAEKLQNFIGSCFRVHSLHVNRNGKEEDKNERKRAKGRARKGEVSDQEERKSNDTQPTLTQWSQEGRQRLKQMLNFYLISDTLTNYLFFCVSDCV